MIIMAFGHYVWLRGLIYHFRWQLTFGISTSPTISLSIKFYQNALLTHLLK